MRCLARRSGSGPSWRTWTPATSSVSPADGRRVSVLWKNSARHNALLLTEQCDNYCLMCSQPPKERDGSWLFDRARKVISLLPPDARTLSLTGGEPTLHADTLIGLLEHCQRAAPELSVHLLTNGRQFADAEFTRRYAAAGPDRRPAAHRPGPHRPGRLSDTRVIIPYVCAVAWAACRCA